jgi:CRP-like cAMP-binding protein
MARTRSLLVTHPSLTTLRRLDLFASLPDEELDRLTSIMELVPARPGDRLETQHRPVRSWSLLVFGHAMIERDGARIGLLPAGQSWSEYSILNGLRSSISVVALSPSVLLRVSRSEFFRLPDSHPVLAGRLVARAAASSDRLALPVFNALRHMEASGMGHTA